MSGLFLGVGINAYPGSPLQGCVNDIENVCRYLIESNGMEWSDLQVCTDQRAHAHGIMSRLYRLRNFAEKASPGDNALFWYSGHGAQIPARGNSGELDGYLEALVPYDFDWDDPDYWIADKDMFKIFGSANLKANVTIVLDSCFSGGMGESSKSKTFLPGSPQSRRYPFPNKLDFIVRRNGIGSGGRVRKLTENVNVLRNCLIIEGCQENQTGADAYIDARYQGAFSYCFLKALRGNPDATVRSLIDATNEELARRKFEQRCKVTGRLDLLEKPFLSK